MHNQKVLRTKFKRFEAVYRFKQFGRCVWFTLKKKKLQIGLTVNLDSVCACCVLISCWNIQVLVKLYQNLVNHPCNIFVRLGSVILQASAGYCKMVWFDDVRFSPPSWFYECGLLRSDLCLPPVSYVLFRCYCVTNCNKHCPFTSLGSSQGSIPSCLFLHVKALLFTQTDCLSLFRFCSALWVV